MIFCLFGWFFLSSFLNNLLECVFKISTMWMISCLIEYYKPLHQYSLTYKFPI